jgi:hypothetical protein
MGINHERVSGPEEEAVTGVHAEAAPSAKTKLHRSLEGSVDRNFALQSSEHYHGELVGVAGIWGRPWHC